MYKKLISAVLIASMVFLIFNLPVSAKEKDTTFGFGSNLSFSALSAPVLAKTIVFLDSGFILEYSIMETYESESSESKTVTSSADLKKSFGQVLGTLTAKSTFNINGITSKPTGASGTYNVPSYRVSTSSSLGPTQFNAWTQIVFDGTCTQTPSTFHLVCSFTCDANGVVNANWTT